MAPREMIISGVRSPRPTGMAGKVYVPRRVSLGKSASPPRQATPPPASYLPRLLLLGQLEEEALAAASGSKLGAILGVGHRRHGRSGLQHLGPELAGVQVHEMH